MGEDYADERDAEHRSMDVEWAGLDWLCLLCVLRCALLAGLSWFVLAGCSLGCAGWAWLGRASYARLGWLGWACPAELGSAS